MASKFTKQKLNELKEAFKDFDTDGSGIISAEEFRSFMKKQAHDHDKNISDVEIDIMVKYWLPSFQGWDIKLVRLLTKNQHTLRKLLYLVNRHSTKSSKIGHLNRKCFKTEVVKK